MLWLGPGVLYAQQSSRGPGATPERQVGVWEENGPEAAWATQVRAWGSLRWGGEDEDVF